MASHVVVIATDLRRTIVKVTPVTYLSDVLDQACKKLNLSSDKYLFRHNQKQVDLSIPFRSSGLVAGAKLELVQRSNTPSAVQIALQIPQQEAKDIPGGRLIKKFPSDLALWQVMRQFESGEASAGKNINITARGYANTTSGSGQLYYEAPVLNIMGRELSTFADFQKTLSQLGHNSGNVLIRLGYRRTEQSLFEAMEQISSYFKEADEKEDNAQKSETEKGATAKTQHDSVMTDFSSEPAALQSSPNQFRGEAMDSASSTNVKSGEHGQIASTPSPSPKPAQNPYQPVNVFLAPTGATPAAASVPAFESDFTPTVAHAQLHQARLLDSSRNRRLPSDKELEEKARAEEARLASIKSVLVKVRFPDNTSSEWQLGTQETGAFLYEAVRHVMADPAQKFHLVLSGSKTSIADNSNQSHNLIKAYKLSGRVLVNLVWDDGVPASARKQPFLKANVAELGQEIRVPDVPQIQDEPEDVGPKQEAAKKGDTKEKTDGAKKIPKWLKLGKK